LVGAVNKTVGTSTSAGSIYVFTGQNGFWLEDKIITGNLNIRIVHSLIRFSSKIKKSLLG
jgi:hypothetical protein